MGVCSVFSQERSKIVNDSIGSLEEIVLITTRLPEVKNQSASSVVIIDQKRIESLAQINPDMSHILGLAVPSIGLSSNTTSNRSQSIRGRQMLVLIDGIPQSTPLRNTDRDIRSISPYAIERIEVIEGASALYGSGAVGGIVNFITKKNTTNNVFNGQTTIGLTDSKPFKEDKGRGYKVNQQFYGKYKKLDYLVNGGLVKTGRSIDGEGEVISPRYGLGDVNTLNLLAKIGYDISDRTRIEGMYNFYQSRQDTELITQGGKYLESPAIGILGKKNSAAENEGTKYNHNGYLKLTTKDIYANTDLEVSVFGQRLYTLFDYRENNPKKPRWQETGGQATIKAEKLGARLSLLSKYNFTDDIRTTFLYGGDFLFDKTSQPLVDGRFWVPELKAYNSAAYLQTHTKLYEQFILKVGIRYDNISVDVPDYKTIPLRKGVPAVAVEGGNLSYNKTSFNASLAYNVINEFSPFASFSQGFSIFDLGRVLRDAKSDVVSKIETDPVSTNNYEIGVNSKIANNWNIRASYFWTVSKLGSDLEAGEGGFWKVVRSPQRIKGFEIVVDGKLTDYINLGGSYSNFEGKLKSEDTGKYDKYMSGLSIAAPKMSLYTTVKPLENLNVSLYYTHTGKRNRFEPSTNAKGKLIYKEGEGKVSPIDLFNIAASLKVSKVNFVLGIENLFNKSYYTSTSMLVARDAEYARGNGRYYSLSATFSY